MWNLPFLPFYAGLEFQREPGTSGIPCRVEGELMAKKLFKVRQRVDESLP